MVTWFEAAVLGVVQGLTEFLPISSNAHVRIVSTFLGWPDPGAAFTAVMQLGTETAVLVYFWRDIWRIVSTWARSLVQPAHRGDFDARIRKIRIPRYDDRDSPGKRLAYRFESLSSHQDVMPHGQVPEMLQVFRKMPWQGVFLTDDAVFCHRRND